jgi:flagellar basal body-associated protein FliL
MRRCCTIICICCALIKGEWEEKMKTVLIISIIIVFVVLILSVLTTNKAYSYKHSVDPLENNPHLKDAKNQEEDSTANK